MNDPRYAELAKLLVEYSCGLKKGESVFIDVSDIPDRMTIALIRAARKVGAIPLVETRQSRVVREDGSVIQGLYATGNASASIMGRSYPGAGGTIGPTMCFGFLAAEDAAQNGNHEASAEPVEEEARARAS